MDLFQACACQVKLRPRYPVLGTLIGSRNTAAITSLACRNTSIFLLPFSRNGTIVTTWKAKKPAKYRKKNVFFCGIVRIRLQQVSDARRLYESKMEAKPMIVPALKVSDAKRAFETAAKSASAAKPAVGAGQNTLPRRTLIQTLPNVAPTTRPGQRPAAAAGATNSEPVNPAVSPLVPNFISFFLSTLCIECFPESRNVRNIYKA